MQYLRNNFIITLYGLLTFYLSIAGILEGCGDPGSPYDCESDSFGNNVAIWEENNEILNQFCIHAALKPAGGYWSNFSIISTDGQVSFKPIIDVSPNGNTVALWLAESATTFNQVLVASQLPFGGSWSTPVVISDSAIETVINKSYSIISDDNENITAVWNSYIFNPFDNTAQNRIRSATTRLGENWNSPVTLNDF